MKIKKRELKRAVLWATVLIATIAILILVKALYDGEEGESITEHTKDKNTQEREEEAVKETIEKTWCVNNTSPYCESYKTLSNSILGVMIRWGMILIPLIMAWKFLRFMRNGPD